MTEKAVKENKPRIHTLDEIRGFAVFCMVFYHAFWLLSDMFSVKPAGILYDFFTPVEPFFASVFIFVSGISSRLSHSNVKRGLRLAAIAAGISVVTILILPRFDIYGAQIYFGILHFLACAMLIFALIKPVLDYINPAVGIIICAVLYAFTSGIENGVMSYGELFVLKIPERLYQLSFLFPLGIYTSHFYSADYFPLFPHIFMFIAGSFAGVFAAKGAFPKSMNKKRCPFFAWLGRHALVIYVVHQPIIAGFAYLAELIFKK